MVRVCLVGGLPGHLCHKSAWGPLLSAPAPDSEAVPEPGDTGAAKIEAELWHSRASEGWRKHPEPTYVGHHDERMPRAGADR